MAGVLAWAAGPALAQVSPGPLSDAHKELDKTLSCFECHVGGNRAGGMESRCLACHDGLAETIARGRGFHATVKDHTCGSCHPEHGGRGFALIEWEEGSPQRFDHRRAGWALEGAHAKLDCRKCHTPKLQRSAAAAKIRARDHAKSWLGLEADCASCHDDLHRGQLGVKCADCHGQNAWKPASGFDHAKTRYPLLDAHATVACVKCHGAVPAKTTAKNVAAATVEMTWKPIAHAGCDNCHRDPHQKRFGGACADCHTTKSFQVIDHDHFDHGKTRYPLRGAHATVACDKCHDPKTAWGERPRFARCDDCHRDPHAGTATLAGTVADCASCHDVRAFRPSTYTVEAHRRSSYPLDAAHARARCEDCHRKVQASAATASLGAARVAMRPTHDRCVDCHVDPHGESFMSDARRGNDDASSAAGDACLTCHDLRAFRPSNLDVARHARFAFKLEGAHGAIPCEACHEDLRKRPHVSTLVAVTVGRTVRPGSLTFATKARACADCHRDPHDGQFQHRADRGACDGCHGVAAWSPASTFDHDRDASFKLGSGHARVPCAECHLAKAGGKGVRNIVYRPVASGCRDCHGPKVPGVSDASP